MASLANRVKKLVEVEEIAKAKGNGDANAYMHGMANGLILARAIMEETEVKYLEISEYPTTPRVSAKPETDA